MSELIKKLQLVIFDFDGVFTDNKVYVNEEGLETVVCDRSDGIGISRLVSGGVKVFIVSTETNKVVTARANKLKIKAFQGVDDKLEFVKSRLILENISPENVAFVGNDINDLKVMKFVGCAICPSDAYPEIIKISRIVSEKKGGNGAVREICDFISNSKEIKSKYE